MSEENKNLNTISEDTANADSNAVAETADKKEDTKAQLQWQSPLLLSLW